jgi:processive 1,2-diacylglycerol beta-glucosyltransferase
VTPRVLILSAPYGAGHARAAAALAGAFAAEGADPEVLDHFERFVSPVVARASVRLFWTVLRRAPGLWGLAYRLAARLPVRSPGMAGADRLGARRLARHLAEHPPAVVVHVHPTPAGALAWLRGRGQARVPHGIVLTDLVAHPQWVYPGLDRYFAPTPEVAEGLVRLGAPGERVVSSGIPVDPAFARPADRPALQAALGLRPGRPTVLVMGGMRGTVGRSETAAAVLAGLQADFQAVVVSGEHGGLAARLRARHAADARFLVLGCVERVADVMGAADVVVTKAGALTCAEALALERPLVLFGSLPGQERENERVLERAGAAVRAGDPERLAGVLAALLADPAGRARLAAGARRLRRPEAGRTVAKEMLALVGRAGT